MANTSVYGICATRQQAESAVSALTKAGFRADDISLLAPNPESSKELATEKDTKAPEGTTTGATAGGLLGGALGLLAGIGAIAIPGVGPFIAAGPIMGTLAGVGAGATAGGVLGALIGAGIPEYEAKRYEGRIREGGILVSVHCEDSDLVDRAEDILTNCGAEDVSSSSEASADMKVKRRAV